MNKTAFRKSFLGRDVPRRHPFSAMRGEGDRGLRSRAGDISTIDLFLRHFVRNEGDGGLKREGTRAEVSPS